MRANALTAAVMLSQQSQRHQGEDLNVHLAVTVDGNDSSRSEWDVALEFDGRAET